MNFLPATLDLNLFLLFGLLLLVGLVAGEIAHKTPIIPRITGFMAVGLLIGPSGLDILTKDLLSQSHVFIDMALMLILYDLGRQLKVFPQLLRSHFPRLMLLESFLPFIFITVGLALMGFPLLPSAIAGAIGMSGSPAIVLMVMREFGAKGQVSTHALRLLACNNILAFFMFTTLVGIAHFTQHASWATVILNPLYILLGSIGVAGGLAVISALIVRWVEPDATDRFVLVVALLAVGLGVTEMLNLSPMLASLIFGVMIANHGAARVLREDKMAQAAELFFILLFVLAGAKISLTALVAYWPLALAFVGLRFAGKALAVWQVIPQEVLDNRQKIALAATLQPMAGMAIGLATSLNTVYPEIGFLLTVVILGSVAILETLGPLVTEWGLKLAK